MPAELKLDAAGHPIRLCPSLEFGNKQGTKTLVFLSGFPDTETSGWGPTLPLFEKHKDCRLICICLPDLNNTHEPPKAWGYGIREVLEMVSRTIDHHVGEEAKVHLVVHDWGAFFGFLYENNYPKRVERLVVLDVGLVGGFKSMLPQHIPILLLYQWWFAVSYFISQSVSELLGYLLMSLYFCLPSFFLPCPSDTLKRPRRELKVHHTYLYYHFWHAYFFDRSKLMIGKFPACPIFFMGFLDRIAAHPHSKYLAIDSGHWFQHSHPDLVVKEISTFCKL